MGGGQQRKSCRRIVGAQRQRHADAEGGRYLVVELVSQRQLGDEDVVFALEVSVGGRIRCCRGYLCFRMHQQQATGQGCAIVEGRQRRVIGYGAQHLRVGRHGIAGAQAADRDLRHVEAGGVGVVQSERQQSGAAQGGDVLAMECHLGVLSRNSLLVFAVSGAAVP